MKPWILTVLLLTACGSAHPAPGSTPQHDHETDTSPGNAGAVTAGTPQPQEAPAAITTVTRGELDEIIQKGPGYLLAMVQTDSVVEKGRFIGFRIVSFRVEASSVLGLQPGDVVRSVNGISVERPDNLVKIFEKLKTANALTFAVLRDNMPSELSTPIQ
jgi:type II secretory pathway component PulC